MQLEGPNPFSRFRVVSVYIFVFSADVSIQRLGSGNTIPLFKATCVRVLNSWHAFPTTNLGILSCWYLMCIKSCHGFCVANCFHIDPILRWTCAASESKGSVPICLGSGMKTIVSGARHWKSCNDISHFLHSAQQNFFLRKFSRPTNQSLLKRTKQGATSEDLDYSEGHVEKVAEKPRKSERNLWNMRRGEQ